MISGGISPRNFEPGGHIPHPPVGDAHAEKLHVKVVWLIKIVGYKGFKALALKALCSKIFSGGSLKKVGQAMFVGLYKYLRLWSPKDDGTICGHVRSRKPLQKNIEPGYKSNQLVGLGSSLVGP